VVSRHVGDVQEAFGMLNEMGKAGVMPTVDTFNTLMDACIRRVDPSAVLRLFRQMVQSGSLVYGTVYWTHLHASAFAQVDGMHL